MIARLLAAFVALAVMIGVVQVGELRSAPAVASELGADAAPDLELGAPVQPVAAHVPVRQLVAVEMPSIDQPATSSVSSRTFRPPRS